MVRSKKDKSLIFMLVWAVITLGADAFVLHGIGQSLRAAAWPRAAGTIIGSSVKEVRGNKGTTYRLSVRYTYEVDGQPYQGSRHRFTAWNTSSLDAAEALVERYPAGARVTVFHAPDASDSVLETGLSGGDLFLLLFLFPFNLVLVGTVLAALGKQKQDSSVVKAEQRSGRLHVLLNDTPPKLAGALGAGGTCFAALLLVGIPTDFAPRLPAAILAWAAVAAAGVYATRWMRAREASGHYDLVLMPRARRLSLPAIAGRKERLDVAWDEVQAITVETHVEKTGRGSRTTYRPTLSLTGDGRPRQTIVMDVSDEDRAEALAAWLRAQLKPDASKAA
jgi:hypothetical protein